MADNHTNAGLGGDEACDAGTGFRLAFEHAPIGLAVVSAEGRWLQVNRALCNILGYAESELLGTNISALAHHDELHENRALLADLMDGRADAVCVDRRGVRADGAVVPLRVSISTVRAPDGAPHYFITQLQDLTEHQRAQAELRAAHARFEALVEHGTDMMTLLDEHGTVLYVTPAFERITGDPPDTFVGKSFGTSVHPDDLPGLTKSFDRLVTREAKTGTSRYRVLHREHGWRWCETSCVDRRDDPDVGGFIATTRDVTERVETAEALRLQAMYDPLTGLPNRLLLQDRVDTALARAQRHETNLALVFFDIDHFKAVNDILGHAAGDELLCAVAERLQSRLRFSDTIARVGGDEFVALIEDLDRDTAHENICALLDALLTVLREPVILDGRSVDVSCSAGVVASDGTRTFDELLRDADIAMYEAKAGGRDRWIEHDLAMSEAAHKRFETRSTLRAALDDDRVAVVYQSIIDLATERVIGAEALARLHHEDRLLLPDEFIDIAEESGDISRLGDSVLAQACAAAVDWCGTGRFVTVNVSARQLADESLPERVLHTLAAAGLAPGRLCLEVTETAMLALGADVPPVVSALHDAGVQFALDDFGTGWASMTHLRRLPLSHVKIDRSFVSGIARKDSTVDIEVVKAVIALAHALGIPVIAEGVETTESAAMLRGLGADFAQGYLWGRPAAELPAIASLV